MQFDNEVMRQKLAHVYWMGGSPCSGKSSIADSLAEKHGLRIYRCDDAFYVHKGLITPERQPVFSRLAALSSEALWMRPVKQQIREELEFYREEFPMILDDLLALPQTPPILAEGAALLPELVSSLLLDTKRALWVVPTASFQLHYYPQRAWAWDIVKDCSDPTQAFENWMKRDIGFAEFVARQATELSLTVLLVDGKHSLAENSSFVERHFAFSLMQESGPGGSQMAG